MPALVLGRGRLRGRRAWYGRACWLDDVELLLMSIRGSRHLRTRHVSAEAVRNVARVDAAAANGTSGGDVATAHGTVARRIGRSRSVVERARRWLREMGLAVEIERGRYLTAAERHAAGTGQIRAASTRLLIHAPGRSRARRCRPRDVLPRRGSVISETHGESIHVKRRPVDNSPVPMPRQRLAGMLAAALDRRGLHILGDRHIGHLIRALDDADLPPDTIADDVINAVDLFGADVPRGGIRNPFGWYVAQILDVAVEIRTQRGRRLDAPTARRCADGRHRYRAIISSTLLGCLDCEAIKTVSARVDT